jgi:hypothetical protein
MKRAIKYTLVVTAVLMDIRMYSKRPTNENDHQTKLYSLCKSNMLLHNELHGSAVGGKCLNTRSSCKDLCELTLKNIHMYCVHVNVIFRRVRKIAKSDY